MKIEKYFLDAARFALYDIQKFGKKTKLHAAIGIRKDGAIVYARNGDQNFPTLSAHAETRLCRKLGKDSPLVFVIRVNKQGNWMMSKPCVNCERALRNKGVKRVIYTVSHEMWEQMLF